MRLKSIYLILLLTLIEWRIGEFKSIRTTTTTAVESDSVATSMTTIENSLNKLWQYKYQHHLFANPATMSRFNANNTFSIMSDESTSEEKEDEIDQDEEDDGDNNPDSSKYLFYPDYSRFDPKTNSVKHYFYHNNNRYPFSLLDLEENASSLELLTNNRNKNNNNIFQYLQQQQQQQTTAAVFTTSSSFQQQSSIGGGSSSPTNHYQVITICNTLPSILKCQNRQHYLIIYKVIYGINDLKYQSECSLNTKCMQVDEKDEQNCTGSNICVFYPVEKQLVKCNFIKSNLTQIQIACVNLSHLKKYYIQRNKKFDQKAFEQNSGDGESAVSPSSSINSNNNSKSTTVKSKVNLSSSKKIGSANLSNLNLEYLRKRQNATANLTASSSGNSGGGFIENRSKTSLHLDYSNTNQNSVIAISLITFFSLLAVILISLIYYRLKIKQLITASGLGVSSSEERTTPTTTSSINGGANTTGAVAAAANSAAATNHQQLCSTIGTTGTSTTISSSTQNTLTKSLPPPPPGFESSTNNSAQATLEKEAIVEADDKKKTSKKEEKEEIIVSDKPLSSHQKQEAKKAEEKNEQTISQEQNSNQNPTVQASGLVTHLRQQLNNLHTHLKKYNTSSSSSSQQAVKNLKPQQPKSMNDCSKQKHAGKSTSCVIPLGEGESSGKANSTPNPSAASVQKPVLTVTDAEDYYPSMSRTKQENSKIYNIDESSAIQQQQPKSRTLTGTTEIYANLSMRSKSNTSMSSKLTEATAAVVAANRGSIKSSIKKNKKAIAAVAAAKAAAAAAGDKDSKLKGRSDNSDYYQIVSNAVSKVANGNGTNKKIKHSEKEPRSVVNNNTNTNNSKSSSKPTAQSNTSSSPKKENPTTKNTITSSSHYENSSIVSNSMNSISNGGVEINNNGDYNTSTTLTGGLNNGINGSSSSSTSNMSLSSSSLSSTVAAASSASSSAATSSLSTAATAAGSLSSAVTSSAATNELYYQRSSVAGFNFTYMLYDIPEEEDEDNQTDRDVSNCDEILKI